MPSHFEGMINLRGQILGVFNVRKKLLPNSNENINLKKTEVIIVIEKNGISVGMTVDEVTKVLHVEENTMSPAPLKFDDPAKNFVLFVIRSAEELIMVLDADRLLELDKYKKQLAG